MKMATANCKDYVFDEDLPIGRISTACNHGAGTHYVIQHIMISLYRQTGAPRQGTNVPRIFIGNCIYSQDMIRKGQFVKLNIKYLLLILIRAFYIFVVIIYFQPSVANDIYIVLTVIAMYLWYVPPV
jgi:hypothetical protein